MPGRCKRFAVTVWTFVLLTSIMANGMFPHVVELIISHMGTGYMVYHYYSLWERRRNAFRFLIAVTVFGYAPALAVGIMSAVEYYGEFYMHPCG